MSEGLSYAMVIDTTAFEAGIKKIVDGVRNAASNAEFESERIQKLFTDIPEVDIEVITNATETASSMKDAFAEIKRVIRTNEDALIELETEYARLGKEANAAFMKGDDKTYFELTRQKEAVKKCTDFRKELTRVTIELSNKLVAEERKMKENTKATENLGRTQGSLRTQIRAVMAEMASLRYEAEKNGQTINESTGRYRELAEELGRLKDIQGDVARQGSTLANDENQFQGAISGLTGLSGAFSAAQGTMALFGSENENLQKVMTKLQAVMAITMGLQQIQQTLNKDSAFSLVTLNSLKNLWNKLMGESNAAQAVNNAETQTSVALTEQQAAATEAAAKAEEENTAAQNTNNSATKNGTAGKIANAKATKAATGATETNTTTIETNTVVTKKATIATKLFNLALKSTVIGAVIAGVVSLISWISDLIFKEDEATTKAKELKEINDESAKVYAKTQLEIGGYIRRIENFNGTQEQEKNLLKEVNDKFGEQFGYMEDLQTAKDKLSEKSEAYCRALAKEAEAQVYLNRYVAAYTKLLEIEEKIKAGKYRTIFNSKEGNDYAENFVRKVYKDKAKAEHDKYVNKMLEAQNERLSANIGGHTDPSKGTKDNSTSKSKDNFDPKAAARQRKEALKQYEDAVKQYAKETNQEISQANIDAMEDGLEKELAQIQAQTKAKQDAWKNHLMQLATVLKATEKAQYMSQKGHTEEGWEASEKGKMSISDYKDKILANPKNAELSERYYARQAQITEIGEKQINDIRQKYQDKWIKDYGSDLQKAELLQREWNKRLTQILSESPELYDAAQKAMEQDLGKANLDKFKLSINWDDVFGKLEDQSLQSLQFTLDKVKTYFNKAKGSMSVTEIKDFQEAITKMEDEIASRNPFTALHKSFKDISVAKTELVDALKELDLSQTELNDATSEHNALTAEKNKLIEIERRSDQKDEICALEQAQEKVLDTERAYQDALKNRNKLTEEVKAGNLASDAEELADANNAVTETELAHKDAIEQRNEAQSAVTDQEVAQAAIRLVSVNDKLVTSTTRVTTAQTKNTKAEQNVLDARNKVTKSYKQFANNLRVAGGVVTDLGGKAKKLASIFSDDIAEAMEKSLDFITDILDAATGVISTLGEVSQNVAKRVTETVTAVADGTKATSVAAAASISTIEKASVILAIISAALQIATAIASLFNDDKKKQKEIERLQERIDQLQWELDNANTVRLQKDTVSAMEKLKQIYSEAYNEVLRLHGVTQKTSIWQKYFVAARSEAEIYAKTIEKIADYWANVDYTAGKALGTRRYKESRRQLENLAEQQILIQKQIEAEESKKKSDSGKIQDYKNQIAEIAQKMSDLINDMLEDIIGASAEDLSKTLGDAFFDAVAQGEEAMESWAQTTKELVRDILKQMLVQRYLEAEIGTIFDKYKAKWFKDGKFQGVDAVINNAQDLADEINAVGETFNATWNTLSASLGKWFDEDAERTGTSKGIATASQESVDENNARLTTIQGHTYSLVQGVNELNSTANAMLDKLTGIEENTSETNDRLDNLDKRVKRVGDTLETIQTNGLRLK